MRHWMMFSDVTQARLLIHKKLQETDVLIVNSSVSWKQVVQQIIHRNKGSRNWGILVILHENDKTNRKIKLSKQSLTVSAPIWTHCLTGDNVTWCYFCPINLQLFSHLTCRNTTSQNLNLSKILRNATILQFNTAVNKEALFNSECLYCQILDMAPSKVRPPTTLLLTSHQQQLHSAPKRHFLSSHQRKDLKRGWTSLLSPLDSVKSPPYGCHSLNSYNICLCETTECIQWINNKTMATFHPATRLSAQWNALLWLSKHSPCTEWTSHKTSSWAPYSMWV